MAHLMLQQNVFARTACARPQRKVLSRAAAQETPEINRAVWFPGSPPPAWLDGSLAGDYGFDPFGLGEDPAYLRWFVHAELMNGRVAMMGITGILFPSLFAEVGGFYFPEWFEAGQVYIEKNGAVPFGVLVVIQVAMSNFVEVARFEDFRKPGSQASGQILGITDDFKGVANGYPGGKFFDPMGFSRGSPEAFTAWKQREIINARLAMVSMLGYFAQYTATDKGPVQNLKDHITDPGHNTFATNGLSLPFLFPNVAP